ncbi:MAG: sugar ABC transporter permease [Bifidobacteriaceae bacterium]|jgi:N,N'-diacetylchitobiose transport system permease protein|nr:sugar ABC transporter permease [Bifidobacteriaceae bacterium]
MTTTTPAAAGPDGLASAAAACAAAPAVPAVPASRAPGAAPPAALSSPAEPAVAARAARGLAAGTATGSVSPRPGGRPRRRLVWTPYALTAPAVAILLIALAYPVGWQLVTSFKEFGLAQQFGQPAEFNGLSNYIAIVTNGDIWMVVVRSVAFCLVNAFLTVAVGTGLATLMNAVAKPVRLTLQICLLLAWAMPVVAVMTVWNWLFDWNHGTVNWLAVRLGADQYWHHNWLEKPLSFYAVATVIIVWMSVPFVAFSVYAALTQVSGEVLEAAQIDGANGWQRFSRIVMPLVRPVLTIVLLLQIIWDLRVFTQIRMLQDRGSFPSQTDLLGTYIYREGVGANHFGMAAAMSVFVLLITIVAAWPYVRSLMREEAI